MKNAQSLLFFSVFLFNKPPRLFLYLSKLPPPPQFIDPIAFSLLHPSWAHFPP